MVAASDFQFPAYHPYPYQDSNLLAQLHYLPGLRELLMVRQVHALEHATVWVLGEMRSRQAGLPHETESFGGFSTEQGFYLYGSVTTAMLRRAVTIALHRLTQGDWQLAIHPRCGTNLSVGMLLASGFALGLHVFLPKGPIEQLLGFGVATAAAAQLAPELGAIAQQYITTAIPFNLAVDRVVEVPDDATGRPTHFVQVHWVDLKEPLPA
ncbi:MAG: DUF6391 domain-containing protein [Thainema sp.]